MLPSLYFTQRYAKKLNQWSEMPGSRAYTGTHLLNTRLIRVVTGEASFTVGSLQMSTKKMRDPCRIVSM